MAETHNVSQVEVTYVCPPFGGTMNRIFRLNVFARPLLFLGNNESETLFYQFVESYICEVENVEQIRCLCILAIKSYAGATEETWTSVRCRPRLQGDVSDQYEYVNA